MKNKLKVFLTLGIMLVLFCVMGISASAYELYEPDGTSSTVYKYDSSECNRSLIIRCYDTSGNHLKTVNYQTKRGEDTIICLRIYDYDITAFESDQGLWETCKLQYTSGGGFAYSDIDINYYFRTALSAETLNVTLTMRKMEGIQVTEYHHLQHQPAEGLYYATFTRKYSRTATVDVGQYVYWGGGYTGYSAQGSFKSSISGYFSYSWTNNVYRNIEEGDDDWDVIQSADYDDRVDYTEFDESEDGKLTYVTNRTMSVEFYYWLNQYTVSFSANGGSGSVPASQTQYYTFDVTIGNEVPTRSGYVFRGWGTYASDTTPNYQPGDTYTMGLSQTLYAVWEDYEFSISNLKVAEEEIFANSKITVSVRTDNWDRDKAYYDIPVELYFDNTLVARSYVDFEEYGVAYLTYTVDVGTVLGKHTLEARINWNDRYNEVDSTNNNVIIEIYTRKDEFGFDVVVLTGNSRYTEGTEVTTSYLIYNDSERNVYPTTGATAYFFAYYYEGDELVTLSKQAWENYVVPAEKNNLIYFRWYIPDGLADVTVYCECSINADGKLKEPVLDNNTATLTTIIAAKRTSQTENPSYSADRPSDYVTTSPPTVKDGSASWNMWEYEYGSFVLKTYGIKIAVSESYVLPSDNCESAFYDGGVLNVKSGYGISLVYDGYITSLSGYSTPGVESFTGIQTVYATFPEYRYLEEDGKYRVLEYADGIWCFVENDGADGGERLHYTPVWIEDGEYVLSYTVTDVWTPAGMITAVYNAKVVIDGSMYDDWYKN